MFLVSPFAVRRCLALVAAAAVCAGCQGLKPPPEPNDETFRAAAGVDRPKEQDTTLPWGYSSRSREIERDLGVR
jgi:hypothetical protein